MPDNRAKAATSILNGSARSRRNGHSGRSRRNGHSLRSAHNRRSVHNRRIRRRNRRKRNKRQYKDASLRPRDTAAIPAASSRRH
ncbi:hypothetical protein PACILC2_12730 [Paenibacillus cisolokensis]|uniref:Uncharacterized protein n=1 Tax=Paenibacillus cisolokensis TaxID=1658519 RepID=A0ABQ4N3F9_9BACL|nr:hypothetical protein PACILC2_12730 [Paenibacillus cisolokensis]